MLVEDLHIPGSPTVTTAVVGERGCVVIATIADPAPVEVRGGKPYCGTGSLEPAIAVALKAARSLAEALRGPLAGKPVVHAALVAHGAGTPFTHLDVLVTPPADLATSLFAYPVVHGPEQVSLSTSVVRGMAGNTVPRSFPGPAPRERSAAEIASIKARPAPPPTPQPWRQWSPGATTRPPKRTWANRRPEEPRRSPRASTSGPPKRRGRSTKGRRQGFLPAMVLALVVAVVALAGLRYLRNRANEPGYPTPVTPATQGPETPATTAPLLTTANPTPVTLATRAPETPATNAPVVMTANAPRHYAQPLVLYVAASPAQVGSHGGTVTVSATLKDAATCDLKLLSRQSFPVVYASNVRLCTKHFTAHVTIGANPTPVRRSVAFELTARNGKSSFGARFRVLLAPHARSTTAIAPTTALPLGETTAAPPLPAAGAVQVTAISVSVSLSSSSRDPSPSLTGSYTATATATCRYPDGSAGPCGLPDGTISWEALGGHVGGNFMEPTTQFSGCTSQVEGTSGTSSCAVNWGTHGDQWLTATYRSLPSSHLKGQLAVRQTSDLRLQAPVDFGARYSYNTYGNIGPHDIGDCMMAATADWTETTFGSAPAAQAIVGDYRAAESKLNGGADIGLSAAQLFSYWRSNGIAGTILTGVKPISTNEVRPELNSYVLFATANLPSGYPLGDGQGGGHGWILVGYSSFGPMVVSWGQEFQISWADFDAWTTGVWVLGARRG